MGSKDGFNINPPAPANYRPPVAPKAPPPTSRQKYSADRISQLEHDVRTLQDIVDRQARELSEVSAAIGTDAYLDPPDGGSVSLGGQVRRMREELVGLLQRVYDADQAARHEKPYNMSKLMDDIETVLQRHQQ